MCAVALIRLKCKISLSRKFKLGERRCNKKVKFDAVDAQHSRNGSGNNYCLRGRNEHTHTKTHTKKLATLFEHTNEMLQTPFNLTHLLEKILCILKVKVKRAIYDYFVYLEAITFSRNSFALHCLSVVYR